jgi:hypothetical protein
VSPLREARDCRHLYIGGAMSGQILRIAGVPPEIEGYRFVGIATLHEDFCVLVWAEECFKDETARALAEQHLDAAPRWLEIATTRFMAYDDPSRGTTFVCTLDPTRTSVLWHSDSDAPVGTVASHELVQICLDAEWPHDAAVDLIEAFARASTMRIPGAARWALIEEALEHVERWMSRLGAADCRSPRALR